MRKVAIITRTLNRPLLLQRAAQSILNQTFEDYCWVVVNNGPEDPVNRITSDFPKEKIIIHNPKPRGMTASSNIGLKSSQSEYVVLLDDDDTWHPQFLEKTTSYLDSLDPSDIQQGVITYCEEVREEIVGNSIKIKKREPYNTWITEVTLFSILESNIFTTNSFLFRRKVFEEVDYYDENLLALGDWEFNIRFLLKYDIGLIPEILANYHKREKTHANTSRSKTVQNYDDILRNHFLRKDIQSGTIGIGYFMNVSRLINRMNNKVHKIEMQLQQLETSSNLNNQNTSNSLQRIGRQLQNMESWPNILPTPIKKVLRKLAERSKFRKKVLIFSPHCDDVPLSLGGSLLGRFLGDQVKVIIVFSRSNFTLEQPGTAPELETTAIRKKEEIEAAKFAHYTPYFLEFKEALIRSNQYQSDSLCNPDLSVYQDPIFPVLKEKIKNLISSHDGLICTPLSYGDHIDHRIIFTIIQEILSDNPNLPVIFYEDLPYAQYVLISNPQKEICPVFNKFALSPYLFSDFEINQKRKLLEIYKTQLDSCQIGAVMDYWKLIGFGERLWLTKKAKKLLKL